MDDVAYSKFVCFKGGSVSCHGIIGANSGFNWYQKHWAKMDCSFNTKYIFKLWFVDSRYVQKNDLSTDTSIDCSDDIVCLSIEEAIEFYKEIHINWHKIGMSLPLVQIHVLMEHGTNVAAFKTIQEHDIFPKTTK